MIVGVGVDICQIDRVAAMLERRPALVERLFTPVEITTADGRARSVASLAARFAAKEALAKALGSPGGLSWQDAEVVSTPAGQPEIAVRGTVAARAAQLGVQQIRVSLSHDGGLATAFVVCEGAS